MSIFFEGRNGSYRIGYQRGIICENWGEMRWDPAWRNFPHIYRRFLWWWGSDAFHSNITFLVPTLTTLLIQERGITASTKNKIKFKFKYYLFWGDFCVSGNPQVLWGALTETPQQRRKKSSMWNILC